MGNHKRFFGVWDDESELFHGHKPVQYDLPAQTIPEEVMARDFAGADGRAALLAQIREVLYARYSGYGEYGTDYEMWARVLFVGADGKLYEVHASHCSCYVLRDQWKPSEVSAQDILADLKMGGYAWDAYAANERYAIAIGLASYVALDTKPQSAYTIKMDFEALRERLLRVITRYELANPGTVTPFQIGSVALAANPDALTMAMSSVNRDGLAQIDTALFRELLMDLICYPTSEA